jgi:hypothetical protein
LERNSGLYVLSKDPSFFKNRIEKYHLQNNPFLVLILC